MIPAVADGNSAWFALIGALGGVLLTGTMSLITAVLNQRWGETARRRTTAEADTRTRHEQLRAVCHDYLVAANAFFQALDQVSLKASRGEQFDPAEHTRAADQALQDAYVYLTISAGARIRELARAYNQSQYDLEPVARAGDRAAWERQSQLVRGRRYEVRAAMRTALGVTD
jgi:hypothetical protein